MTITVFGATGMVGKQIVKQALWKGHNVKAFGRNINKLEIEDDKLELIKGTVFDDEAVENAIKGSDAILSALGGAFDGVDKTRSLGIKKIIEQMKKTGLKRIIAIGGMGVLNTPDGHLIVDSNHYPQQYLPVGKEHLQAFTHLKASNLDWTFVCPPNIIDAEVTGEYKALANFPPEGESRINSGDLALFMISELERNAFLKSKVGICN